MLHSNLITMGFYFHFKLGHTPPSLASSSWLVFLLIFVAIKSFWNDHKLQILFQKKFDLCELDQKGD